MLQAGWSWESMHPMYVDAKPMPTPLHVQEFLALGLANFFGSMFNASATSGTFSRSAVCTR